MTDLKHCFGPSLYLYVMPWLPQQWPALYNKWPGTSHDLPWIISWCCSASASSPACFSLDSAAPSRNTNLKQIQDFTKTPADATYRVFVKYCVFFQEFSKVCHLSLATTRLLLAVQKNYQPIGVTVHSHCAQSFDGLLQRCRRGRGCSELWKNTIFPEHPVVYQFYACSHI